MTDVVALIKAVELKVGEQYSKYGVMPATQGGGVTVGGGTVPSQSSQPLFLHVELKGVPSPHIVTPLRQTTPSW